MLTEPKEILLFSISERKGDHLDHLPEFVFIVLMWRMQFLSFRAKQFVQGSCHICHIALMRY